MRKFVFAASVVALGLSATPAFAQSASSAFTGPRIGIIAATGGQHVIDFDEQTIGFDGGYDFDLGGAVAGFGVEYQTDLGRDFLDANQTAFLARIGAKIGDHALLYATGGYARLSSGATPFGKYHADGYLVGGGAEFALGGGGTSFKIEERYLNYGHSADAFQTLAGLSFRFGGGVREEMAPPPPPPPAPPPPPPPPATQTCADGSVILATDACPPPPPPPPPAAEPERG